MPEQVILPDQADCSGLVWTRTFSRKSEAPPSIIQPTRWPRWITADQRLGVRILALVHVVRGLVSGGEVTRQDQDFAVV